MASAGVASPSKRPGALRWAVRGLRVLMVLALALASVVLVAASPSAADTIRPFTPVFSTQTNGALLITGNTLLRCAPSTSCTNAQNGTVAAGNNDFDMVAQDSDADASTATSSSAGLALPAGARVLFAGLFWGAGGANVPAGRTQLRFRVPGGSYQTVTASATDIQGNVRDYSSFVDVTARVQAAGTGTYWGADIATPIGNNRYAGWSLVVAYQDPTAPLRDLTVFSGYASVSDAAVNTTISGFLAPPQGPVNARFGAVAYEGDDDITGDLFAVNGTRLADAESPSGNFFKSRITAGGQNLTNRNPAYLNNMGVDAKVVNAPGVIPNGARSANLTFNTTGDAYYPAALTTQIDIFAPAIQGTKTVVNRSGNNPSGIGDTLDYTMTFSNTGQDNALNSVIEDALPANTTFVPGSLQVTAGAGSGPKTDGAGDDQAEYVAATRTVRFRVGPGANASVGGTLGTNATTTVRFSVTIDAAAAGTTLPNTASLAYTAATLGTRFVYQTAEVRTPVAESADLSLTKTASPEPVIAGNTVTYTLRAANAGPSRATGVSIADTLPDGAVFVSATSPQGPCQNQARDVTCTIGAVASGGAATVTIVVRVPAGSTEAALTNVANVTSATSDPDPSNNSASAGSSITRQADVSLTKTADPASPAPGEDVTWTIVATNNGPSTATQVTMSDDVPSPFGPPTVTSAGAVCGVNGSAVGCVVPSLAPGASATMRVTATLDPAYPGGPIPNTADVVSQTPDPDPDNNQATSTITPAAPRADLQVTKETTTSPLVAGMPVSYQITVRNDGPSDAQNVVLTDGTPAALTDVTVNSSAGTCTVTNGTITCTGATLTAGSVQTVTVNAVVSPDATGTIANSASVAADTADPNPANDTATVTDPVTASSDLAITKSASPTPAVDGQPLVYRLTVTNTGPSAARNVVVTDPVPSPLTFTSSTSSQGTCTQTAGTVTCDIGTVGVGDTVTVTVTAAIPAAGGASGAENTAGVTSTTPDPNDGNNEATFTILTGPQANLSLTKDASPSPAVAGGQVTYTLTVTNNGPSDAQDITVSDPLPDGLNAVSATSPGATCGVAGGVVTCTRATLPVGVTVTVTISGTLDAGTAAGSLTNVATVAAVTPDPSDSDNTATTTTPVATQADLEVTKTGPATVTAGDTISWTIVVTNHGSSDAADAQVSDLLPNAVTFVGGSGPGGDCAQPADAGSTTLVTCPVGSLAAGDSQTITLTGRVDPSVESGAVLHNVAGVSASTTDPTPGNNLATAPTSVSSSADLRISKSVDPDPLTAGAEAVYTINVVNAGPSTAVDASGSDVIPPGFEILSATSPLVDCTVSGQVVTCRRDTIPPGATAQVQVRVRVPAGQVADVTNTADVRSDTFDPDLSNNQATITNPVQRIADLEVIKTVDQDQAVAGSGLTYRISVTNHGPSDTTAVTLTDTLPPGLTVGGLSPDQGSCTNVVQTITCDLGDLASGASTNVVVTASIDAALTATEITNTATATSAVPDPDPERATDSVTTPVVTQADVSVQKSTNPAAVVPGASVSYTLLVLNAGPSTARDVVVTDTVPDGVTILGATVNNTPCTVNGQDVTCTIGDLIAGQVVVTIEGRLDPGFNGAQLTNTGKVATTTPDPSQGDHTSTTTAPVVAQADLTIVKTMDPAAPVAGQTVTYTLTATNNGPSNARSPQFIDQLPPGLTNVTVVPPPTATCDILPPNDPGTDDNPTAPTVICSSALFPAGATVTGTITATVAPGFQGTLTNTGRISSDTIDPVADNNESTASGATEQSADLSLTKTVQPTSPVPGDDVTFTLEMANAGPSTARDITLTDQLDPSLTDVRATAGDGNTCSVDATNLLTCQVAAVPVTQTRVVEVTAHLAPGFTGTLTNSAEANAATPDPDPTNNTSAIEATTSPRSDLTAAKSIGSDTVVSGGKATYVLTVHNDGPSTARDAVIADVLDPALTYLSSSSETGSCARTDHTVDCRWPTIATGDTVTARLVVRVSSEYTGSLKNTAKVTSPTPDPDKRNDVASVTATVVPPGQPPAAPGGPSGQPAPAGSPIPPALAGTGAPAGALPLLVLALTALALGTALVVADRRRRPRA